MNQYIRILLKHRKSEKFKQDGWFRIEENMWKKQIGGDN